MKLSPASLGLLVSLAVTAALAQPPAPAATSTAAAKPLTFDVISIKPNKTGDPGASMGMNADGFTARNVDLHNLLLQAFRLQEDDELIGEPKWASADRWDIDARVPPEEIDFLAKMNYQQRMGMFQEILAQRFALKVHHETRELPAYVLVLAKGGAKLQPSKINPDDPMIAGLPGNINSSRGRVGKITATQATMSGLAEELSDASGRQVVDHTGLTGRYDFKLTWTPEEDATAGTSPDPNAPSLFTAVEEQLGLRLEATKAPVEVLVIDHIERPTEN